MNKKHLSNFKKIFFATLFAFTSIAAFANTSSLISPANNARLVVEGNPNNEVTINWTSNTNLTNPSYSWVLADASALVVIPPSPIAVGTDTSLVLDFGTIDDVLAGAGVAVGDSADLTWWVAASDGISTQNSDTFNIRLVRGVIIETFNLISPPHGFSANIGGSPATPVEITWEASNPSASYTWELGLAGGNFTPIVATVPSNNAGADTVLTLTFSTIESVLAGAGVPIGGTANLEWRVKAVVGNDSIYSDSTYSINLTRGNMVDTFNLIAPPNGFTATIGGDPNTPVIVSWQASSPAVNYTWELALAGTSFSSILFSTHSDNNGADTALSLNFGAIHAVLGMAGVAVNDPQVNLEWRIKAVLGNDSIYSNTSAAINLTRGVLLSNFDLVSPANNDTLTIQGNPSNTIDIVWNASGEGVNYTWEADVLGLSFSPPLVSVPSNNMGADTVLTLDVATINGLLAANGVNVGDTAELIWRVKAQNSSDSIYSISTYNIVLIRGAINQSFNLINPFDGFSATIEGNPETEAEISWSASNAGANYTWELGLAGGNFNPIVVAVPSNNNGLDTNLTLDYRTIDAVLAGAGVTVGNTANLEWRVKAVFGNDSIYSDSIFAINLSRGNLLDTFNLLSPPNAFAATIQGNPNNPVTVSWTPSAAGANYEWELAIAGTNFNPVIFSAASDNAGLDTNLSLNFGAIDAVLDLAGVGIGATANLEWRVKAEGFNDSIYSNQAFTIDLTRGQLLNNFDLIAPADSFAATIAGDAATPVVVSWESAGDSAAYTWELSVAGSNFSPIVFSTASDNNGNDTILSLNFGAIDAVLDLAGVAIGNTVDLEWRIKADAFGDSIYSNTARVITLTRGLVVTPPSLISPPNNTNLLVEGPADATVDISWTAASYTSATYEWYAGLRGDNFNTIVVGPIPSNNSGADTVLTLDLATLDAVLGGANNLSAVFNLGDTAELEWTVRAIDGTDTVVSNQTWNINLIRGNIFTPHNLIFPNDNFSAVIEGKASTEIDIVWSSYAPNAVYEWVLDAPFGEIAISSLDTVLTLDFASIDGVLQLQGLNIGDAAVTLPWNVRAILNGDTVTAANGTFNITLERGVLFVDDFTLATPPSDLVLPVQGERTDEIVASWVNAQANGRGEVEYQWQIAALGTNFAIPAFDLPSDSNALSTQITLTIGALDDFLQGVVNVGDTLATEWRVIATNSLNSALQDTSNVFVLNLVRTEPTSMNEISAFGEIKIYPNPSNGQFWVNLPNSITEYHTANVQIMDITGKTIYSSVINGGATQLINLNENGTFNAGIYLINIIAGESRITEKIIIY